MPHFNYLLLIILLFAGVHLRASPISFSVPKQNHRYSKKQYKRQKRMKERIFKIKQRIQRTQDVVGIILIGVLVSVLGLIFLAIFTTGLLQLLALILLGLILGAIVTLIILIANFNMIGA